MGENPVSKHIILEHTAHEVSSKVLIIKIVSEEWQHIGGANVDVAVHQVIAELASVVLREQRRVQLHDSVFWVVGVHNQLIGVSVDCHYRVILLTNGGKM